MSFKVDKFNFNVSNLKKIDYSKQYFDLLGQLSDIDSNKISKEEFDKFVDNLSENHIIKVIKYNQQIIGTVTILKEKKLLHNFGIVAHIEDVVIDKNFRGLGLGKLIIDIAKKECDGCYKVILNCKDHNIGFYEKCGFTKRNTEMSLYKN